MRRVARQQAKPKKQAKPTQRRGSDGKPVTNPQGDYAHKATPPPMPDPSEIDLTGNYDKGQTPELVMNGRMQVVAALLLQGEPGFSIKSYCRRAWGISQTQANYIVSRVRTSWRAEFEEGMQTARAEAVTRLRRDLSRMRQDKANGVPGVRWADIARHESLLASIEGTAQPVRVDVQDNSTAMREALSAVMGALSEEDIETYIAEGYEAANEDTPLLPVGDTDGAAAE